jgi:hypothetical protein
VGNRSVVVYAQVRHIVGTQETLAEHELVVVAVTVPTACKIRLSHGVQDCSPS